MSCCDGADKIKTIIIELNTQIADLILERQKIVEKHELIRDQYKYFIYTPYRDFYMIQELQTKYNETELKLLKPIFESLIRDSYNHYKLLNPKSIE
tara:strand:+ start:378 stop:665 length:288 start_codon:yes stop_codon:yes gene_type:complete